MKSGSPGLPRFARNDSPMLRNDSPTLRNDSPTLRNDGPTLRNNESVHGKERQRRGNPCPRDDWLQQARIEVMPIGIALLYQRNLFHA